MSVSEPSFTIGIEEEYLLVDRETRDLVEEAPAELMAACEEACGSQITSEFLRSQVEIGTRVCKSISEARGELARLRGSVAGVAERFGLAPIAASTHPFAKWASQHHTDKERYNALANDLQVVGRRMLICGMHVHIGVDDDELRIDLMNQLGYFLPHLLALSTSSPFWQGDKTGLKSYRLSVFDELPRTGLPPHFASFSEYQRTVNTLVKAGLIEDSTKIWWDLRPSARFPTIEMRVTDVCTLIEDTVCVASLYMCICRMLYRLRRNNQRWRYYLPFLVKENRWRAQRYGIEDGLVDFGRGEIVGMHELLEELLELVAEDADHFGCRTELERARTITAEGTSADRQIRLFEKLKSEGADDLEAHKAIVDHLVRETVTGTDFATSR